MPIVALYALAVFQSFVPFSTLLRDANTIAHDSESGLTFYHGALSNIGILLWWSSAAVCAMTAYVLDQSQPEARLEKGLFLYFAVFTGSLALDDLFMIHEEIFPLLLGIPEVVLYIIYGVLSIGLLRFIGVIFRADFLLLGTAFCFFTVSIVVDQAGAPDTLRGVGLLTEDLTKMLGIVCWFIFALRLSGQCLTPRGADRSITLTDKALPSDLDVRAVWLRQMAHTARLEGNYVAAQRLERQALAELKTPSSKESE